MSWRDRSVSSPAPLSVWLYVRQSVWAWPVGIANSACWLVLFWSSRLYLDAGLQLVYIALGVAGWYWWLRGGDRRARLAVPRTAGRETVALVLVGVGRHGRTVVGDGCWSATRRRCPTRRPRSCR